MGKDGKIEGIDSGLKPDNLPTLITLKGNISEVHHSFHCLHSVRTADLEKLGKHLQVRLT